MCRVKKYLLLLLTVLVTFEVDADSKISINVDNASLAHIFSLLASAKGLNFVVDPAVEQTLTLQLKDVQWQDALDIIKYLARVEVVQHANVLLVRAEDPQNIESDLDASPPKNKKTPLIQRIFPLKFIEASELEKQLTALPRDGVGREGKLYVDHQQQQIIIWDDEQSLEKITQWILLHDQPQPQIEIVAQMISISQDHLRELGVSWFNDPPSSSEGGVVRAQFTTYLGVNAPALRAKAAIAKIDSQLLYLELSALEQENQIEIIASPHLVTSQGRTASIKQGTEIPYQTVSGKNDNPVINFKEAVLGMEVTPERVGRQHIRLRLRLNQDVPGKVLQSEGKGPPSIDKQEIKTEVVVENGTTIALGGIFQQHQHQGMAAIPGLGRIPLIGLLFQKQTREHQKRELVIFITPRLLPTGNLP
ncbi:type IV pilus secretin PilQ [Tatumella sp. TA1]|uniref:type IV pilus secretin PilQ n=1 Tax=Rosenbergiella collisarenosi TaxID=1544695 RepID=UPI001316262C|nr:type IV pilus secretin PilQ [Rosenbergiella collisarenosi]QGX90213.1 type IV pilus secretin PilQ [Tatumella sp. TA1]